MHRRCQWESPVKSGDKRLQKNDQMWTRARWWGAGIVCGTGSVNMYMYDIVNVTKNMFLVKCMHDTQQLSSLSHKHTFNHSCHLTALKVWRALASPRPRYSPHRATSLSPDRSE